METVLSDLKMDNQLVENLVYQSESHLVELKVVNLAVYWADY